LLAPFLRDGFKKVWEDYYWGREVLLEKLFIGTGPTFLLRVVTLIVEGLVKPLG